MRRKYSRSWTIFRVRGIIATAKQIHKEYGYMEATELIYTANNLLMKLKEKK